MTNEEITKAINKCQYRHTGMGDEYAIIVVRKWKNRGKARMNEKVCCNCRHNIRKKDKDGRIECECDIDNSYIGYVQCMESRCKHWAKEKESGEKNAYTDNG